jgi:hypothetical protein
MKMMLATLTILAFAGCAPSVEYAWYKNGASTQDFNRDKYRCLQESTRAGYASQPVFNAYSGQYLGQSARGGAYTDWGMYSACMQASGWSFLPRNQ